VVPGSLATLRGTNLQGTNVQVSLNGVTSRLLFTSSDQINFAVPAELTGATAQLAVTVNGVASTAFTVNLAQSSPGIFVPGILNQDYTVNSPTNPAPTGSFVQIFATGLLPPDGSGTVEVQLHDQPPIRPTYAGPAPQLPGVQQVNARIPEGWPTMTTDVAVCTTVSGQRACSPKVRISMIQAQQP
jgi:uncharacterized protein (TIGR03437 family)